MVKNKTAVLQQVALHLSGNFVIHELQCYALTMRAFHSALVTVRGVSGISYVPCAHLKDTTGLRPPNCALALQLCGRGPGYGSSERL